MLGKAKILLGLLLVIVFSMFLDYKKINEYRIIQLQNAGETDYVSPLITMAPFSESYSSTPPSVTEVLGSVITTPKVTVKPTVIVTPKQTTKPKVTSAPTAMPSATVKPTVKPTLVPTTPIPTTTIDYSKPWTVATSCPASTMACVPCNSGSDCRYEPGKVNKHGFRGWACQNNNPGNIRNASTNMSTDFKNVMIVKNGGTAACGVRYDSRGGSYFVFSTYSAGYGALKAYIKGINNGQHSAYAGSGWKCGDCTLSQFFSKYAPGDSSYASKVATYIGEPTSQKLSYVVANKLDLFAEAIKVREGFITK